MARWLVYILRCRDGSLYTGATNDLARRLACHAAGKGARYTRSRLPIELVYSRTARGKGAALSAEAGLKRLSRREKLAVVAGATRPARSRPGRGGVPRPTSRRVRTLARRRA